MKNFTASIIAAFLVSSALGFTAPAAFPRTSPATTRIPPLNAYVPDGLTREEYQQIKTKEKHALLEKDLGRLGPRGFKSRSLQAWQTAWENGEADHAFAPIGYREKLEKGLIRKEDVPYMVRGGSWDNSDVSGAKKLKWSKLDKEYATSGYKKEQSVSILGSGPGLDWAGKLSRSEAPKRKFPGFS